MSEHESDPLNLFRSLSIEDGLLLIERSVIMWAEYFAMKENGQLFDLEGVIRENGDSPSWPSRVASWNPSMQKRRDALLYTFYNNLNYKRIWGTSKALVYSPERVAQSEQLRRLIRLVDCTRELTANRALFFFETILERWVQSIDDNSVLAFARGYKSFSDALNWDVQRCREFIVYLLVLQREIA